MQRFSVTFFLFYFFLFATVKTNAQESASGAFSNIHFRTIPVADSFKVDSLMIVPGSFSVYGIEDSNFYFLPERSLLVWRHPPGADSVRVRYRIFPSALTQVYRHRDASMVDSVFVSLIYPRPDELPGNLVEAPPLDYHGSYSRNIMLGNSQDVVLNSQFNLQANGYILDSIKLEAAITDNTLPLQPEGNTQRLQEFDQVYIRLTKKQHFLQLGDYSLHPRPGYFLQFNKRVQGIYYKDAFRVGKSVNKFGLSGSVTKGQFARNQFQGGEGNQGPYKLTGNNGEQFFIVLAGTERVYINNLMMERGENADYIINYNTAEITFMPRRMITKDSRIQVEFEYQDRNYLNSLLYAWDEINLTKKWNLRAMVYSNQDAKNQLYQQNLSGAQENFLSSIGDSIQNAFFPNIVADTFAANKVLYRLTDTLVNGVYFDSVFVYSTNADSALYRLSFSYVGAGKGDYILASTNTNGRVYSWTAPVNGRPQGNFAPVQLLITPKKQQLFVVNSLYEIDSSKHLEIEIAGSNNDPNLFSKKDNNTHWGMATRLKYDEKRASLQKKESGEPIFEWNNSLNYEFVQHRFKAIAPYHNVEFARDWNLTTQTSPADEHFLRAITAINHKQLGELSYDFSFLKRGSYYSGYRNILGYDYNRYSLKAGFIANALQTTDSTYNTTFLRPSAYAEYKWKRWNDLAIGATFHLEHNAMREEKRDTLLPGSFSFDVATAYLHSNAAEKNYWSLTYSRRRDRVTVLDEWLQSSHSNNVEAKFTLDNWQNHLINFTGSYRQLIVDEAVDSAQKSENTLLGRLEFNSTLLRRMITFSGTYEFGSGQEQKRSYTYIEVPAGQGVYTWIDYNNDGVQQVNEFEVALYPDQKRFIRIFTPTNEYVRVNYVNSNGVVTIEPAAFWERHSSNGIQKFVGRFYSQTSVQVANRLLASYGLRAFNPFQSAAEDTTLLSTNTSLSTTLYYNRNSALWGIDYSFLLNTGKQLMMYGVEGNASSQHLYKLRWNISRQWALNAAARHGNRSYSSALDDHRSYQVASWSAEPGFVFLISSVFRFTTTIKYEERKNASQFGGQEAQIKSLMLDLRYSKPTLGIIQLRGQYSGINYNGGKTDPVSFVLLDALQKGDNFLWYMNWERRIGKGIELSLEYEGRKPATKTIIHTGRMSVRAIL